MNQLRRHYIVKTFDTHKLSVGRNKKYGSYEMFGDKICYYYDTRREDDFVNFLVKKFLEKNPDPNREIRKVFTKLLHNYGLCWFGCIHLDRRYKIFESRMRHGKYEDKYDM